MNATQRQDYILNSLKQRSYIEITWLSENMNVSEMTVRRDLARMEDEGLLLRVHGGVRSLPNVGYEHKLDNRVRIQSQAKRTIGRYAASLVNSGDIIAVDASSTTHAMLRNLNVPVTILTNSISVAFALAENDCAEVILLGGKLRKASLSLVGSDAIQLMENYHVDKVFFSAKAVDLEHGVTDATAEEGEIKRKMLKNGTEIFLLTDHSKFNSCAFYKICGLTDIHHLITDKPLEYTETAKYFLECCCKQGVKIHEIGEN
ncbi:MAG: DeoR/GlpR family DNA-binding transcription regulator [Hydrogenoanaerobacterium sp.]